MESRSILRAHLQIVEGNLERAERAMDSDRIDPELRDAVRRRFATLFHQRRRDLEQIAEDEGRGFDASGLWEDLHRLERDCDGLFREQLAFIEGSLVRSAGLDSGICRAADALLGSLSKDTEITWARLTILAEQEFLNTTAEIIRLRFPDLSVWSLPVAAHEFGHLAVRELKRPTGPEDAEFPIRNILLRAGPNAPHLRELFCDLFAVYALGPSYPCTTVLLRFGPRRFDRDAGQDHPADRKRVHVVLRALRGLDPENRAYDDIAGLLQGAWETARADAGMSAELSDEEAADLDDRVDEWLDILDELAPKARYDGWLRAVRLRDRLTTARGAADLDGADVADVLNAAWLRRLDAWDEPGVVAVLDRRALELVLAAASEGRPEENGR